MTTRSGGQPGYVGLARRTRQALGLPEFLPAHRTEVAIHACRLLVKLSEPASAGEADPSIDAMLFVLARQVSRALARAMARVAPLGRSATSRR